MPKTDSQQNQALYRKYRPQSFNDIVGQDHIVTVLTGEIKNSTTAHAYLFTGGRGTGKTSIARIFAKALGTEQIDIHEIDAASYRGIDDIKDIREHMMALPVMSQKAVYIIDEVHMLSKDAFGALLKIIEEPPRHIIVVLATTEFDKVPETIQSRCQVFHFKKPSRSDLVSSCQHILKNEQREIAQEGIELIVAIGDGSYRDMQSTLEKVVSSTADKKISIDHVAHVLGAPSHTMVMDFLRSLNASDTAGMLAVIKDLSVKHIAVATFLKILLMYVRGIIFARFDATLYKSEYAFLDPGFVDEMKKEGSNITSATLAKLIDAIQAADQLFDPELALIMFATAQSAK